MCMVCISVSRHINGTRPTLVVSNDTYSHEKEKQEMSSPMIALQDVTKAPGSGRSN